MSKKGVCKFVISRIALAKQADNRFGCVHLSVCPSICPFEYYQSEKVVCVSVIRGFMGIIFLVQAVGFLILKTYHKRVNHSTTDNMLAVPVSFHVYALK